MLKDFQNHPKGNAFYPQLLEASGTDIPSESDAPSPEETAEKRKLRMFVLGLPGRNAREKTAGILARQIYR